MPSRRSCRNVSSRLPSSVPTTRSGLSATMASRLGLIMPPTRGLARAAGGQSQKSLTPTRRASPPSANAVSVTLGTRETMRAGGADRLTSRPSMSRTTSTCAGDAGRRVAHTLAERKHRRAVVNDRLSAMDLVGVDVGAGRGVERAAGEDTAAHAPRGLRPSERRDDGQQSEPARAGDVRLHMIGVVETLAEHLVAAADADDDAAVASGACDRAEIGRAHV